MNREILFALISALNVGLTFLNIPPGITVLMGLYGVGYTGISVLMSALLWSHALMQVPAGILADRFGTKRAIVLSLLFMFLGNTLPAVAPVLGLAILGRVITGVGTSLGFVTLMKMMALHAPKGRSGAYQGFFAGIFSFGNILAYCLIPRLVVLNWRWVFLAPALFSLLLLLLCFGIRGDSRPPASFEPLRIRNLVRIKVGWVLGLYHALSWGTMINLGNWIPSLLAEYWANSSPAQLAWGGILVMLISGMARISGGIVLLRVAPLFLANASILSLTFIFIGLFTAGTPEFLLPLSLLAAFFSCVNFGSLFQLASSAAEQGSLATLFGFVNFLANVGAVLFTLLFGVVKDGTGSFSWTFGVLALLAAVALPLGYPTLKRQCSRASHLLHRKAKVKV